MINLAHLGTIIGSATKEMALTNMCKYPFDFSGSRVWTYTSLKAHDMIILMKHSPEIVHSKYSSRVVYMIVVLKILY